MTMVVGVDVTVVDRIAAALRRHPRFAQRIYTDADVLVSIDTIRTLANRLSSDQADCPTKCSSD